MSNYILEISNISKQFLFKKVLKDISFSLLPGKFYSLIGENGAGKSTIFKIIVGLEYPNDGTGLLLGESLTEISASNKHKIGIVSEQIELEGPLNMQDFFQFYSTFFPKWDSKLFNYIIRHQKLDLRKQFKKYSRGEKMQLVLIAELCKSPEILLIDEITSVLDIYGRQFYLNLFRDYTTKKNGTIFLTTNIITEASHFIDHIFVLKNGRLIFDDAKINISESVLKISDKFNGEINGDFLALPDFKLANTTANQHIPSSFVSTPTMEELFLFLYRRKDNKGAYDKVA